MATTKKTKKRSTANKTTKKLSPAKKSVTSTSSKKSGRKKSGKPASAPGLLGKAGQVVRNVVTFAGAATGAIVGAAESGIRATEIGQSTKSASKGKKRPATPKAE